MHQRQIIRTQVAELLGTVPLLAGRTFTTRTRPTDAKELPVALVYTLSETSELATMAGDLRRTLSLVVELRLAGADDELDDLCALVEAVMSPGFNLGGTAFLSTLAGTVIGLGGEGETAYLVATLTYTVLYDTAA